MESTLLGGEAAVEPESFDFTAEEPSAEDVFLQGLDYDLPDTSHVSFDPTAWNFIQGPGMADLSSSSRSPWTLRGS